MYGLAASQATTRQHSEQRGGGVLMNDEPVVTTYDDTDAWCEECGDYRVRKHGEKCPICKDEQR